MSERQLRRQDGGQGVANVYTPLLTHDISFIHFPHRFPQFEEALTRMNGILHMFVRIIYWCPEKSHQFALRVTSSRFNMASKAMLILYCKRQGFKLTVEELEGEVLQRFIFEPLDDCSENTLAYKWKHHHFGDIDIVNARDLVNEIYLSVFSRNEMILACYSWRAIEIVKSLMRSAHGIEINASPAPRDDTVIVCPRCSPRMMITIMTENLDSIREELIEQILSGNYTKLL
jgi:hypothetical protein